MRCKGVFTNAFKKDMKTICKKHANDAKQIVHSIEDILFLVDPFNADTRQLQCFEYYRAIMDLIGKK